jgi:hypothetical protein
MKPFVDEPPRLHPSEREFDLALVGAASAEFDRHCQNCRDCQERWAALQKSQETFASSIEPARAAQTIHTALQKRSWRARFLRLALVPALGACAAAGWAIFWRAPDDGVRLKGAVAVDVFVKRAGQAPERFAPGDPLRDGDAVQLGYRAAGDRRVQVFSVEKGCAVRAEYSGAAEPNGLIPLSWELHGASGDERLYVAFARRPISLEEFAAALRATPGGCEARPAPDLSTPTFFARGVTLRSTVLP